MTVLILYFIILSADLVPIYSFGESDIYDQVPSPRGSKLRKVQTFIKNIIGFAPALFKGRGFFNYTIGVLPYRRPINSVGMCEIRE